MMKVVLKSTNMSIIELAIYGCHSVSTVSACMVQIWPARNSDIPTPPDMPLLEHWGKEIQQQSCNVIIHCLNSIYSYICVTSLGEISLNVANNFIQYPQVKPYGTIFFKKKIYDRKG